MLLTLDVAQQNFAKPRILYVYVYLGFDITNTLRRQQKMPDEVLRN